MAAPVFRRQAAAPQPVGPAPQLVQDLEPWGVPQTFHDGPNALAPTTVGNAPVKLPAAGPVTLPPATQPITDKLKFPSVIESVVQCPNASNLFLNAPAGRRTVLALRNVTAAGGANIGISFGTQASANSVIFLAPGQFIGFDDTIPQNDIYSFADAVAGGQLAFFYADQPIPA